VISFRRGDVVKKDLGTILKEQRQLKGLTQKELAQETNVSHQAISRWERNDSTPDVKNLITLSNLYGISLDNLVKPDEVMFDELHVKKEVFIILALILGLLTIIMSAFVSSFYINNSSHLDLVIIIYLLVLGVNLIVVSSMYFVKYRRKGLQLFLLINYFASALSFVIWVLSDSGVID
jgi:transcriptional regulator with XRE-family HTH domain